MATSVLDQIRTVEHQKVKVKTETLRKIKQALNELNKLGFDYRVVGNGRVSEAVRRSSRTHKKCPLQNLRLSHREAA
jgi:chaperonin cofactor prefoldin